MQIGNASTAHARDVDAKEGGAGSFGEFFLLDFIIRKALFCCVNRGPAARFDTDRYSHLLPFWSS